MSTIFKTVEDVVKFFTEHYNQGGRAYEDRKKEEKMTEKRIKNIEKELQKLFGTASQMKLTLMLRDGDSWKQSKSELVGNAKSMLNTKKENKIQMGENLQSFIDHLDKKLK